MCILNAFLLLICFYSVYETGGLLNDMWDHKDGNKTNRVSEKVIVNLPLFILIRISFWPLLLLIALFLLLLLLAKRRKDEDESWGSERIFVEDDTKDMDMKTWSGKWSHKK